LWSLLDRLLIPSGRWFLRRRLNRLIDRVNRRLDVEIKPFQLTLFHIVGPVEPAPAFVEMRRFQAIARARYDG